MARAVEGREREVRDFFARLATIEDLDGLGPAQIDELVAKLVELFPYLGGQRLGGETEFEIDPLSEFSARGPTAREKELTPEELRLKRLRQVHADCNCIAQALDGGSFQLPYVSNEFFLDPHSETLMSWDLAVPTPENYHYSLQQLVAPNKPFPFRRCPRCSTIFARTGNQRYCSRNCTVAANEDARREAKREYMRRYNRRNRQG